MEQKDYLLREIEKIGAVMRAILNMLTRNAEDEAIKLENRFEQTKETLFDETGLDLNKLLELDLPETKNYISQFNGFKIENLELLAEILFRSGIKNNTDSDKQLLDKSLMLYEMCNETDKTFSAEREEKIRFIKEFLLH